MMVWPSKPLAGLTLSHAEMSTSAEPLNMYGPVATRLRPYAPALPSKHLPISCGIGAVAGIAIAKRKSPRGFVSLMTSVDEFGVVMPETFLPLAPFAQPTMSEY